MKLQTGEMTVLKLKVDAASGHLWHIPHSSEYEVVDWISSQANKKYNETTPVGGPFEQLFTIKSLTDKPFSIMAIYKRAWEDEVIKTKIFNFN